VLAVHLEIMESFRAVHAHGINAARLFRDGDMDGPLRETGLVADASKQVVVKLDALIER